MQLPKSSQGWTPSLLVSVLRWVQGQADAQRRRLSMNNAHVMELDRLADSLPAGQRAAAKAKVKALYRRQVQAVAAYRTFSKSWANAVAKSRDWLRQIGVTIPEGLGVLPLVPIVIAGLVLLAAAYVAKIAIQTAGVSKAIDLTGQELRLVASGQATPAQIAQLEQARARTLEEQAGATAGDPLGLANLLKTATPLIVIVAAALLLPPILRSISGGQES